MMPLALAECAFYAHAKRDATPNDGFAVSAAGLLGIAMDMSIQLQAAATGAICTLSLSFNNDDANAEILNR